jgi:nitrogen fixation NifU-like protein
MNTEEVRDKILTHARSKLNGQLPKDGDFEGYLSNPLCGDRVQIRGSFNGMRIGAVGFDAQGCAMCMASASLLCSQLTGRSRQEALIFTRAFEDTIFSSPDEPWPEDLKALESFEHLRANPARRACVLLPHLVVRLMFKENRL